MSITKKIADRLKKADEMLENTLKETEELIKEAKDIHDKATAEIQELVKKKNLSEIDKQKYAELMTARAEAERAYYLLINLVKYYKGNNE